MSLLPKRLVSIFKERQWLPGESQKKHIYSSDVGKLVLFLSDSDSHHFSDYAVFILDSPSDAQDIYDALAISFFDLSVRIKKHDLGTFVVVDGPGASQLSFDGFKALSDARERSTFKGASEELKQANSRRSPSRVKERLPSCLPV